MWLSHDCMHLSKLKELYTKKYEFAVCKLYLKFLNERKSIAFIYTEDTVNEKPYVK